VEQRLKMWKVTNIVETCFACPSQWEGKTEDGHTIYIRYRWGHLSVRVSYSTSEDISDAVMGKEIISLSYGDGMSGVMSYEELKYLCRDVLELPDEVNYED